LILPAPLPAALSVIISEMWNVITPDGNTATLTLLHPDEFGGLWFTDGNVQYFAHNPTEPHSTDPVVCLSYDYELTET
jgi:hypothetical protein